MNKNAILSSLVPILLTLFFVVGCTGQQQEVTQSIDLDGAEQVQAHIAMSAGELDVNSGVGGLAEIRFLYNESSEKPQVEYAVQDDVGNLLIQQPQTVNIGISERNAWQIDLNESVPLALDVELGAGESHLRLGDLALKQLDVNAGAGDLELDLRGNWRQDLNGRIANGIGRLTLQLPQETGVRVYVDQGLGQINTNGLHQDGQAYVNDSYGESDATLVLTVEAGVGEIDLITAG